VGAVTLTIDDGNNEDFSGGIQDGGGTVSLTKTGSGTQTFSGTNEYTGTTSVQVGTLLVNGSTASGSAVAVAGTLGGNGTIGGSVTVNSSGKITGATDGTIGTLNVGSLSFDGGNYTADLNDDSSDKIIVSGLIDLANTTGGTFTVGQSGTPSDGTAFVLIETSSGVTDTFSNVSEGASTTVGGKAAHYSYVGGAGANDFILRVGGPAVYSGGPGADTFQVQRSGGNIQVLQGGTVIDAFPSGSVTQITINGSGGDDTLTIDYGTSTSFDRPIVFNGEGGDDRLVIDLNNDAGNLTSNTFTFNGGETDETDGDSIEVRNTPNVSGAGSKYIATPDDPDNSGQIVVNPGGGGGADEMTIDFTGLEPSTLSGTGPLTVEVTVDAMTTLELRDAVGANDGWNILDGNSTFEDVTFQGYNTLNVTSGTGAETITLSSLDTADPDAGGALEAISAINLDGDNSAGTDTGSDVFDIQSAPSGVALSLKGGDGSDVFNLGDASNLIAGLDGTIDIDGEEGAADALNITDTGNSSATIDGVLTGTAVTGLGMAVGVTYDNTLESFTVSLGSGADEFNVRSTDSNVAATVNLGGGNDTLTVDSNGATADGTVDNVVSSLTVNGGTGSSDKVVLQDTSDSSADTITLTGTQIGAGGSDSLFGPGGTFTYGTVETLEISAGSGGNTVNIESTASGTNVDFNTGAGTDSVTIGNTTNGVDGVLSIVTVSGQAGDDTLTLDDRNDASGADVITLTTPGGGVDARVASGATNFFGAGGRVDLASMSSLTIQGGSALTVTNGAVLGVDTSIDNTADNQSIQTGSITGSGGPWDLSFDAGTNSVSVGQIGTTAAADDINQVAISGDAGITLNASIYTGEDTSNNAGSLQVNDAVIFAAGVAIDTTDAGGGADGNVTFSGTVDGGQQLTVTAGSGNVAFNDAAGGTNPLAAFIVNSANNLSVESVQTSGTAVTNTINLGATTAIAGTLTIGTYVDSELNTDGAAGNTGGLRINATNQVVLPNDAIFNTDGDGTDGALTFVTGVNLSGSNFANGATFEVGDSVLNLSSATLNQLDFLRINTATNVTLPDLTVSDGAGNSGVGIDVQNGVTGTTTLEGDLDTAGENTAGKVSLAGAGNVILADATVTINTDANTTDADVTLSSNVVDDGNDRGFGITAGQGDVVLGAVGQTGGNGAIGTFSIGGNDISLGGSVEASSISAMADQSGGDDDSISIGNVTLDANSGNMDFASDNISIDSSANLISTGGSGKTVTFTGESAATAIDLGDAGSGLHLSEAELRTIDGASIDEIIVGMDANQTGTITVTDGADGDGNLTPDAGLRLRAESGSASIVINATINLASGDAIGEGLVIEGSGSTTQLNADILTDGAAVNITDDLLVSGDRRIDTDGATGAAESGSGNAAGTVTVQFDVAGANAGGNDTLTIDAADANGDAGVTISGDVAAAGVTGGNNLGGLVMDGSDIALKSMTVDGTSEAVGIDVTGSGTVTLNGAAYQVVNGSGNDPITFNGTVALAYSVTITGGANAGDDVSFTGTIDADNASNDRVFEVNAGAANLDFGGDIGSTTRVDSVDFDGADITVRGIKTEDGSAASANAIDINATDTLTIELTGADGTLDTTGEASGGAVNLTATNGIILDDTTNAGDRELTINTAASTSGGQVDINSVLNSAVGDTLGNALSIAAKDAAVVLDQPLGATTPLSAFSVTSASTVTVQPIDASGGHSGTTNNGISIGTSGLSITNDIDMHGNLKTGAFQVCRSGDIKLAV